MRLSHPIPTTPEFSILEYPGCREYRVEASRSAWRPRHKTRKIQSGVLTSLFLPLAIVICWQTLTGWLRYIITVLMSIILINSTFFQVLYESVVVIPPHGIQLETHRGFSVMRPLITRRQFISSACLDDVVINEGLYGWNVRYYLAAMQRANLHSCCTLAVAYQNILPGHEILLHVYEGIHELLLSREEVGL